MEWNLDIETRPAEPGASCTCEGAAVFEYRRTATAPYVPGLRGELPRDTGPWHGACAHHAASAVLGARGVLLDDWRGDPASVNDP